MQPIMDKQQFTQNNTLHKQRFCYFVSYTAVHRKENITCQVPDCKFKTMYVDRMQNHQRIHNKEYITCLVPGCKYKTMYGEVMQRHQTKFLPAYWESVIPIPFPFLSERFFISQHKHCTITMQSNNQSYHSRYLESHW